MLYCTQANMMRKLASCYEHFKSSSLLILKLNETQNACALEMDGIVFV